MANCLKVLVCLLFLIASDAVAQDLVKVPVQIPAISPA